jgi:hypothetical protein
MCFRAVSADIFFPYSRHTDTMQVYTWCKRKIILRSAAHMPDLESLSDYDPEVRRPGLACRCILTFRVQTDALEFQGRGPTLVHKYVLKYIMAAS